MVVDQACNQFSGQPSDNTEHNGGRYPILGALFGLKPKIWLSYFLETKNYI